MRLIVIRHARAKERDASRWPDDAKRPLTKGGRRDFARLASRLPSWIEPPRVVLSSGWVRAWDTASILANETGWPQAVREPALETEGGEAAVESILRVLRSRESQASIALVGHEPVLGELLGRLLGGRAMVVFRKGAVALIEIDPGEARGTLLALVPPEAVERP
jgi:phosphohistidine phosphatase